VEFNSEHKTFNGTDGWSYHQVAEIQKMTCTATFGLAVSTSFQGINHELKH